MKHAVLFAALLAAAALPVRAQLAPPAASAANQSLESRIAEVTDTDLLGQLIARYRETGDKEAEMAALDRRIALRPHLGSYKLDKIVTLAREGNKNQAYTLLVELQSAGYGYDLRNDPQLANIADTEVWKYIVDNLDANRAPFGAATVVYTLPREDLLIQSLAWDASRKALLVGSARQGSVSIVNAAGKLEPLVKSAADNGLWAVYDMAVDAKRGVLWVASTAVPHFKGYSVEKDLGRAGVFKFDLKTGKFLKSYLSPVEESGQAHFMSSIALGKDGEVYIADGVNRAVYQVRDEQFRRILHLPMLSAISALAVSGDGSKLYLADPERGLIGVELGTLKPFDVRVPPKLTLESIASMEWVDGALVVVQNGMIPKRVMRLDLSPEGNLIAGVRPLEASNPAFGVPGDLSVDGNDIYLIANDQKGNYDRFGLLNDKEKLEGTRILKLRADYQAPGAMQMPQAGGGVLKD